MHRLFCCFFIVLIFDSCQKFLDIGNPPDKVAANYVYNSSKSAAGVLTGIYYDLQREDIGFVQGRTSISFFLGLSADEFNILPLSIYGDFYKHNNHYDLWSPIYKFIYRVNSAIEGISSSTSLSTELKSQLIGEALFLRTFFYFYLTNIYGNVPLLLSSDYKVNANAVKVGRDKIYEQMISDLLEARSLLSDDYKGADATSQVNERIRPNKWCATALLARVYLYNREWLKAEEQATALIENNIMYDTTALSQVFEKNSKEAIWQLQPVSDGGQLNTLEAGLYLLINGSPDEYFNPVWASPYLEMAFEEGDKRRSEWLSEDSSSGIKYVFFSKYKKYLPEDAYSENIMALRLGEQYLIRAEARAQQGESEPAKSDLNVIRKRAGISEVMAGNKDELLRKIWHERQVELFCEWGHRWLDLKRIGMVDAVMGAVVPINGGVWQSYKQLYPIPLDDLKYNVNLVQNEGYPSF